MFKEDGEVLHFASPKVQASVGANTYVPWQLVYDGTGRQIDMEPGVWNWLLVFVEISETTPHEDA